MIKLITAIRKNNQLNALDKCILVANIITSFLLLFTYLCPFANPEEYWLLAILGLGYPILLSLEIFFFFFWVVRFKSYLLISIVVILLGIKPILMNFGFHLPGTPGKKASGSFLRIMAYNVHGFGGFDKSQGKSILTGINKLVENEQPDVLNIEEFYVDVSTRDTVFSSLGKVVNAKGFYFKAYDSERWDTSGIAIVSRLPIINKGVVSSSDSKNPIQAIFADIKNGNYIFRDYCVHLKSTQFADKEHEYLKSLSQSGKFSIGELKLIIEKLKIAFINRSYQVALIKQHMKNCPYPYVIAGDFNDTPISYAVNEINSDLNDAFVKKGSGLGITYYGDFPHFQIDYILASKQFNIENFQTPDKKLSDHFPVISDLSVIKN